MTDEVQAYAAALAAHRRYEKKRKAALEAKARRDTRKMGDLRSKCADALLDELIATNAIDYVGKADPEYVNAKRGV